MASPLLLIGSVVPFRPAVENTSQITNPFSSSSSINFSKLSLLSNDRIFSNLIITTTHRRCNNRTLAAAAAFDGSSRCKPVDPVSSNSPLSGSYTHDNNKNCSFDYPGMKMTESDEALFVFLKMPGVKKEDVKVNVNRNVVDGHSHLTIDGSTHEKGYYGLMYFLDNAYDISSNDTKGVMQDGVFKLTLPKTKVVKRNKKLESSSTNIIANIRTNHIIANFFANKFITNIGTSIKSAFLTCRLVTFGCFLWFLGIIGSAIMRGMVKKLSKAESKSVTMCRKFTDDQSFHMSITYEYGKMELTSQGACVSLNMPELKIEDVKSYVKHDALFIEGEANWAYYVTCVQLPENILKKPNMIKKKMKDGMYKVNLPYATFEIKMS